MTILEAIQNYRTGYYCVTCATCYSHFELSTANYTKLEVAHILIKLGWQVINSSVKCPMCARG